MMTKPTIGLIVPPAHGKVPTDAASLYGDRYNFIARGVGIHAISPAGFEPVVDRIVELAEEVRAAGAEAISVMGTSLTFYRGPAVAENLRQTMEDVTGVPCTTMSHGMVNALRAMGVRRVAVATSYIDDLNQRLQAFLVHHGFTVTAIQGLSIDGVTKAGEVTTETLVDLASTVIERDPSAEGVFISCGGLLTLDAIRILEDRYDLPVTASSPAAFWDVVRTGGWDPSSAQGGRLFQSVHV